MERTSNDRRVVAGSQVGSFSRGCVFSKASGSIRRSLSTGSNGASAVLPTRLDRTDRQDKTDRQIGLELLLLGLSDGVSLFSLGCDHGGFVLILSFAAA